MLPGEMDQNSLHSKYEVSKPFSGSPKAFVEAAVSL